MRFKNSEILFDMGSLFLNGGQLLIIAANFTFKSDGITNSQFSNALKDVENGLSTNAGAYARIFFLRSKGGKMFGYKEALRETIICGFNYESFKI
jgi:hypothetical protein